MAKRKQQVPTIRVIVEGEAKTGKTWVVWALMHTLGSLGVDVSYRNLTGETLLPMRKAQDVADWFRKFTGKLEIREMLPPHPAAHEIRDALERARLQEAKGREKKLARAFPGRRAKLPCGHGALQAYRRDDRDRYSDKPFDCLQCDSSRKKVGMPK